jgi:hypothetical protein
VKFSTAATESYQKSLEQPDQSSGVERYFRPNKIPNNQEVEFIFLAEDPKEYWQAFGESIEDKKAKPFRFPHSDSTPNGPTDKEILEELGGSYRRAKCQFDNEKKKQIANKTDSPAVHCYAWPIWNIDAGCIQIFEVSQESLFRGIMKETGLKKYRKGVSLEKGSEFNCTIHKVKEGYTKYTFNIIDRDEDFDTDAVIDEWEKLVEDGFTMEAYLMGEDPFNS